MNAILQQIGLLGIVPVVVIDDVKNAVPLAGALTEAGLPCAEITFRTDAAAGAIKAMTGAFHRMLVGAGTVIRVEQAKIAVDAGAKFIVSPGVNRGVVEYCLKNSIPVTPGVATPTEVGMALDLGADVLKFFPAEASGGLPYLRAISAPFKDVRFIPTGGISEENLNAYLKFGSVLACGGSWMVRDELIAAAQFNEIERITRQAIQKMLGLDIRMIGMRAHDKAKASSATNALRELLGFQTNGTISAYENAQIDMITQPFPGADGEFVVATMFVDRALAYAKRQGAEELSNTPEDARVSVSFDSGRYAVRFVGV